MTTNSGDQVPLVRPMIGPKERAAVARVLRSDNLAQGPEIEAFEAEFAAMCGTRYAIAVNSGTAALFVAHRGARHRPRRRGHRPAVQLRRHGEHGADGRRPPGVLRRSRRRLQPRSGSDRGPDHTAHAGDRPGAPLRPAGGHDPDHGDRRPPRPRRHRRRLPGARGGVAAASGPGASGPGRSPSTRRRT